jgi:uncharacterized integral membrane protein
LNDKNTVGASEGDGPRSKFARVVQFARHHPMRIGQAALLSLLAIVVLQNLEPTSIDVLFWSFAGLPKLVLILVSMIVGAATWELGFRWFRG